MAVSLGTLSSGSTTTGVQTYFVSVDKRLATGDTVTGTPTITTESTGITISSPLASTAVMSSNDGSIVAPIGRAITFTVTTGRDVNSATAIVINIAYSTTSGWSETLSVSLFIDTTVKIS